MGDIMRGFIPVVMGTLGLIISGITSYALKLAAALEPAFKGLVNSLIGLIEAIPNAFISGLNSIIRAWNNFSLSALGLAIGGVTIVPDISWQTPNLPTLPRVSIPRLAEGGIVTKPTVALIGEAGPEAVVPLNRGRGGPSERPQLLQVFIGGEKIEEFIIRTQSRANERGDTVLVGV